MKIRVQRRVRAIFGLKINPAIFCPFLFPPKEQGIDFNLDSSFKENKQTLCHLIAQRLRPCQPASSWHDGGGRVEIMTTLFVGLRI
jgi:hypothetical protein